MAGLRAFSCYRNVKRPYTRKSKFKRKAFIKSVPNIKLAKFDYGELKKDFSAQIDLVSNQKIQVRHNALESARQVVIRTLNKGTKNYRFKIRVYPHHVLRENKMLTGAGADRMQTGMQKAFGKATGVAAQLKLKQPIFTIYVENQDINLAKRALKAACPKLPGKCSVVVT
ncbi:MAG: 50S ribosomal protein L16 [Candidatus Woesearchaeota archaeon]